MNDFCGTGLDYIYFLLWFVKWLGIPIGFLLMFLFPIRFLPLDYHHVYSLASSLSEVVYINLVLLGPSLVLVSGVYWIGVFVSGIKKSNWFEILRLIKMTRLDWFLVACTIIFTLLLITAWIISTNFAKTSQATVCTNAGGAYIPGFDSCAFETNYCDFEGGYNKNKQWVVFLVKCKDYENQEWLNEQDIALFVQAWRDANQTTRTG